MPALTYDSIATTTLSSSQANITFSNIPNTYTDLKIIFVCRSARANLTDQPRLRPNGDISNIYSSVGMRGNGSTVESFGVASQNFARLGTTMPAATEAANIFSFVEIDIFSYTVSIRKTILSSSNADTNGSGWIDRIATRTQSQDVINSVVLYAEIGPLAAGTTATLYGIKRE